MSDKTLKVQPWSDDQGDYVLIDADSFDENIHSLYDDGTSQAAPREGTIPFLKARLDELGVSYKSTASKPDLIAAIEQAETAQKLASVKTALAEKGVAFEETESLEELQAKLDAAA
jgi:hypothetical protein